MVGSSTLLGVLGPALIFVIYLIVLKCIVKVTTERGRMNMKTNTKKKSKNDIAYLNTIASVSYDFSVSFGAGCLGATVPSITPSRSSATASQLMGRLARLA